MMLLQCLIKKRKVLKNILINKNLEVIIFNKLVCSTKNPNVRETRPKYTFKSGATYEGEWVGNKRDGRGTQVWPDGAKYDG